MRTYTAVDVSQLPFPGIVEELNYETIYNDMREQMRALQPVLFNEDGQAIIKDAELLRDNNGDQYFRVPFSGEAKLLNLELESDPSARQLQIVAFREMFLRQRVNEACKGVMLAYAKDADLDQIGATFGLIRFVLIEGDMSQDIEEVKESDDDFRRRIQLALEGYSTAGPEGAYIFHTLNAHADIKDAAAQSPSFVHAALPDEVKDQLPAGAIVIIPTDSVNLTDPMPGDVAITVLSHIGNGTANAELLSTVDNKLNNEDLRPVTDHVRTRSAEIIEYSVDATIYTFAGPDAEIVLENADLECRRFVEANHKLGRDITLSGLMAALHQPGVQRVELPTFNPIICDRHQAAFCTGITITPGGIDE